MTPPTAHLRKREWRVASIPDHGTALRLIRAWHYSQGAPNTSTYRHGLYRAEFELGDPYGVALWIPPTRSAAAHVAGDDWRGVIALSRLAIDPGMPTNAASFLLGRSMRLIDRARWPVLLTYADRRLGHTGAIYKATNWRCDGEVEAGDVWLNGQGKQTTRKHGGVTYTSAEMVARGWHRAPTGKKIRFVHDVRDADFADDEFHDLYPGSGAVGRAWKTWRGQLFHGEAS